MPRKSATLGRKTGCRLNPILGCRSTGGESPRSNIVFWDCLDDGYLPHASLTPSAAPDPAAPKTPRFDAIAAAPPAALIAAPMVRLGSLIDPPWDVVNLHSDHLGSVRLVTTRQGAIVSKHDYFPFGEEIAPMVDHNTHMFTGHERDRETGLDYMLARYYGSSLARFLSCDPAAAKKQHPESMNKYAYAFNNPLKFWDPDGRETSVLVAQGSNADKFSMFGHAALFTETTSFKGGISRDGSKINDKAAFIKSYTDQGRSVTEFKLNVTSEQETKLTDHIQARGQGGEVDSSVTGATALCTQNCTTAVGNALKAAEVVPKDSTIGDNGLCDTPGQLAADLSEGGESQSLVKEVLVHPATKTEPKKDPPPNRGTYQ